MKPQPAWKEDAVPHFKCPCGCRLTLGRTDYSNEQRLIALLGPEPRYVNLKPNGAMTPAERRVNEPTVSGLCRCCGSKYALPEFLAEFLQRNHAPWPDCDDCARMVVQ